MCELIKNYQNNSTLRQSFNELAQKTFGLSFESWYQNGFWRNNYIPYSMAQGAKIIANVSVNLIDMLWNGNIKHFIQLGTVMTEEKYRHQGLIRKIMKEIEKDFTNVDGMYLFANDSVLDFYPKFGFEKAIEYQYTKQISITQAEATQTEAMLSIPMNNSKAWSLLEHAINHSVPQGCFEMAGNSELIMFYITGFMQENVYYNERLNAYAIAEIENDELYLHAVFAPGKIDLNTMIQAFGKQIRRVCLGFTPECQTGFSARKLKEANTTLFVKGAGFLDFQREQLMFPPLTHA